jgi:phosphoglycerol transferase MdoB-like AlkP superfamily enzyme
VGRQRALAFFLDAAIISALVDLPAVIALAAVFFFFPDVPLGMIGWSAFGLSLLVLLLRDARGGLSRKWLGIQVTDVKGHRPGMARSAARNFPLLVPGWNFYEAWRVARGHPRSVDGPLGLSISRLE